MITPDTTIQATAPFTAPLHWKARAVQYTSLTGLSIAVVHGLWTHNLGEIVAVSMVALFAIVLSAREGDNAKQQDRTDVDVHAVVGANAIQCTPRWGIYNRMIVKVRGTRPPEHETAHWSELAAEEIKKQLERGFCEVSDLQPTKEAGVYSAYISVRLPHPGKDGQHQHIDLSNHLLRKGLLVIDRSEGVTQTAERCVAEAKKKSLGVWRYLK